MSSTFRGSGVTFSETSMAVKAMKQDAFICSVLGPHISEKYAEAKEAEWEAYREQVTDWEISSYLYRI